MRVTEFSGSISKGRLSTLNGCGYPDRHFDAGFRVGGRTVFVKEGRCVSADGALLTMIEAVAHCVRHAQFRFRKPYGWPRSIPARVLERDHELGTVRAGYLADLTRFDDSFVVKGAVERGKWLPRDFLEKAPAMQPASNST
jgi:N-acetylglucosamine-6-phosphate deacetylase